jgi:ATP-dependent DNA helicase RecG
MIEVDNKSSYLQRLSFDEVFANQLGMQIYKKKYQTLNVNKNKRKSKYFKKCLESLSFNLTNSQNECIEDLYSDLCSKTQMKRILQGDVGSGKTIVALAAILNVIENSKQASLMAPTELLSIQHYNFIKNFTESLSIKVALLTSKIDKDERISILDKISNGYIDIVIGTHSLISDRVTFNNLGIAVIDEQHKFGVIQRSKVLAKGENVHLLLLTATPIPRSLSMTVYGDLDLSEIKEKPKNRKKIITKALPLEKYEKVKMAISRALENEEKIYWVCPLLEETEKLDLVSLNNRFKILTKSFSKFNPTLAHGKMDNYEREKSIERFFNNESRILIASTVIEVGIDIPDATIIIIENAERFGLAQLHQLRGRVGRSSLQSYCILMYGKNISEVGKLRLKTMRDTDDGFFIAEKDLELRGPGEVFGTRQSGENELKLLPFIDKEKLVLAKDLAIDIVSTNNLNFEHEVLVSLFNKDEYIKLMS